MHHAEFCISTVALGAWITGWWYRIARCQHFQDPTATASLELPQQFWQKFDVEKVGAWNHWIWTLQSLESLELDPSIDRCQHIQNPTATASLELPQQYWQKFDVEKVGAWNHWIWTLQSLESLELDPSIDRCQHIQNPTATASLELPQQYWQKFDVEKVGAWNHWIWILQSLGSLMLDLTELESLANHRLGIT